MFLSVTRCCRIGGVSIQYLMYQGVSLRALILINKKKQEAILDFWFKEEFAADLEHSSSYLNLWFGASSQTHDDILTRFSSDWACASINEYDDWLENPQGQLALLILLDQVTRHIYMGEARAYCCDAKAQRICLHGISSGADHRLSLVQRAFYYFPLLHAETLLLQEQSILLYETLLDLSLPEYRHVFNKFYQYAVYHHDIIKEYGRFPHRNVVLGRESTAKEQEFLAQVHISSPSKKKK